MELSVQCFGNKDFLIEVGEDDTTETMRRKVATATGLEEDSFYMGFGGKEEGEDITELSAGDKVTLTKTPKYQAIAALLALGADTTDITAESLMEVTDPKVASLLLQAEVATAIPDGFFSHSTAVTCIGSSCVSEMDDEDIRDTSLPHCDTKLDLPALPFVTAISESFLSNCTTLSSVDLTGLQAVTSIGGGFLARCDTLSTVNLAGLQAVTSIGDCFLFCCPVLSNVNLTGLKAVTSIGNGFLARCDTLSTVDLAGLQAVTSIGNGFLARCETLSTVEFTGLQAVTSIGDFSLALCPALSSVDLTGLKAVTSIGNSFISDCEMLSTVDLTGLKAVTSIGNEFLGNCPSLQTAHGRNDCSDVIRKRVDGIATLTN